MTEKIKIFVFFLFFTNLLIAQNAADIDQTIGSGYVGFTQVSAIAVQSNGKIVVGGSLMLGNQGSTYVGHIARFNTDGGLDSSFQALPLLNDGSIFDISIQADGKILVGGNFSQSADKLIRLNSDGSIDNSFLYSIGGAINSIALQADGKIIIAGNISASVNGHYQRKVIRLNTNGSLDPSFDFGFEGFIQSTNAVYKVVVQTDGKILAGGFFNTFNGIPQGMLIRFNPDGSKDTNFNIGTGGGVTIKSITLQSDGKILIGSAMIGWNGQSTGPICRLNNDGTTDNTFNCNPSTSSYVGRSSLQSNGKIVAIGNFTVNGVARHLVRYNSDGSLDNTFTNVPVTNAINCLNLQSDDKILIGGFMYEVDGVMKHSLARMYTDGTLDKTFNLNTGLNERVSTIAVQDNGKTLLGGEFTTFDGVSHNRLIRLNIDGSKDNSFTIGSGFNNVVKKIVVQLDGKIVVGGSFTTFNGAAAHSIIRLNTDGTKDNTFNIGNGFDGEVNSIVLQADGKIVVGGNFINFNGTPQNYCIRLNTNGTKDPTFGSAASFNNKVTYLAMQTDGKIMVGGNFTTFDGQDQKSLIRLNPNATKDTTFDIGAGFQLTSPTDGIKDIEILADGKMYIIAQTFFYNGTNVGSPIRLNTDGSVDTSFTHPFFLNGLGIMDAITVQENGKIIGGGTFTYYNQNGVNTIKRMIIRLHYDGTVDTTFNLEDSIPNHVGGFNPGGVNEIVLEPNGKIWVGGSFFTYRGICSFSVIRLVGDPIISTASIFENEQDEIDLYPNPVHTMLFLNNVVKTIKITDNTGKIVDQIEKTNQVDFSTYIPGLYFLTIEKENGSTTSRKIIKQ